MSTESQEERLQEYFDLHIKDVIGQLDLELDQKCMQIERSSRDDLSKYSILSCVDPQQKKEIVEHCVNSDCKKNRAVGSMVGMAVGDALGHPFEFMPTTDEPSDSYFDLATLKFHNDSNTFNLQRGQWTDDASMGLCVADSLILRQQFDGADMRVRFWCWWNRGYNNAFRKDAHRGGSVGLGGNIAKSLAALSPYAGRVSAIPPAFEAQTEDAGNGSLMRFTPVALFHHNRPLEKVYEFSRRSSYTTHPGIIAAEACALLGHLIVAALNRPEEPQGQQVDAKAFLETETQAYLDNSGLRHKSGWGPDQIKELIAGTADGLRPTERCWAWRETSLDIKGSLYARGHNYHGYPVSAGYFGSYSMDGLAMALWCVYHTNSFDEAVVRSVNLLGDADSHGSICGQLAGALYGYTAINRQFIAWLAQWDDYDFATKALMLLHIGDNTMGVDEQQAPPALPGVSVEASTTDHIDSARQPTRAHSGSARSGPYSVQKGRPPREVGHR